MSVTFAPRLSVVEVEEGPMLAPRFPADGLLSCVTSDATDGALLKLGWKDPEALRLTIETGEDPYFSRTRKAVWHKGAPSGLTQAIVRMRIDDDQDAFWPEVKVAASGAYRHVGYREVPFGPKASGPLQFTETERRFDPVVVYGDAPNRTIL